MEQRNINTFAQELSDIIGQPIGLDHIHSTTIGRYYYTPAPEEGSPLLLHHYRGPFFIDINPEDYRKLAEGEVSPSEYIRTANWLIGYYWGGGSMVGGGYYQPFDIVNHSDDVKRYFKILACRGHKKACGYMPTESYCSKCELENCPFSEFKIGNWNNEIKEYDPRVEFFDALYRKFEAQFPGYALRGFFSSTVAEDTIIISPNMRLNENEPFSFDAFASEKIIDLMMRREITPENWDEFVEKYKFIVHKRFSKEYLVATEESIKASAEEANKRDENCNNVEKKKKEGIIKKLLNFFRK